MTEHNLPDKDDAPWLDCMDGFKQVHKPRSTYHPLLRNLHVRRLYILFGVPVALPIVLVFVVIRSSSEWFPELAKAWQPEHFDKTL
jgi:hypothetical protein